MTKITAEASVLGKALRDVAAIVNRTETVPILSHVMVEAMDGEVRLTATDMTKRVERTIKASIGEAGAFTVEASRFAAVVSSYAGQVAIESEDAAIIVRSGRSRVRFATLQAADFPPMPFEPEATFDAGTDFVAALNQTRHAHGTSAVQFFLLGAFVTDRDGLEVVATDANRMAVAKLDAPGVPDAIIPTATVDLVTKMADGDFRVEFGKAKVRFTLGATVLTSKLIEGTFPKYDHIIPKDTPVSVTIGTEEMKEALGRLSLLADDKDRKVRLRFADEVLTIALDTNLDQAVEEVGCDWTAEPYEVAFRSGYLRDALNAMDADDVVLGISDPTKPMAPITITAARWPGSVLVVMPVSF